MKTNLFRYSLLIVLFASIFSCRKKEDPAPTGGPVSTEITYPDSVLYGGNILSMADSVILQAGAEYSIGADLAPGASLELILNNLSPVNTTTGHTPDWFYDGAANTGFMIGSYDNTLKNQKFTASQKGKIDVKVIFVTDGGPGTCRIDFYENSASVTRSKYIFWQ